MTTGFSTSPSTRGVNFSFTEPTRIRLRPRTYDVLVHLVTHAGRVVGKSELMESVWKDVAVTDDSLVQSLMEIRRALGQAEGIVKTVRGRGYLFDTASRWCTKDAIPTQGQDHHRDQTTDSSARDETSTNRPGLSSALVVVAVIAGIAAIVWWIGLSARRQASASAPAGTIRSIAVCRCKTSRAIRSRNISPMG